MVSSKLPGIEIIGSDIVRVMLLVQIVICCVGSASGIGVGDGEGGSGGGPVAVVSLLQRAAE